ncbi:hypothetical protein Tsubulata_041580 [Turnera subulata]|uniref:HhH-GPD domain-containing protein n=1 Tax=Turnera subulata TaxID=218843 RepID=A0A9Q0EYS3_9ROSI|nr:hypothetical protein Tsubulata_041580 [Turnera subulata]
MILDTSMPGTIIITWKASLQDDAGEKEVEVKAVNVVADDLERTPGQKPMERQRGKKRKHTPKVLLQDKHWPVYAPSHVKAPTTTLSEDVMAPTTPEKKTTSKHLQKKASSTPPAQTIAKILRFQTFKKRSKRTKRSEVYSDKFTFTRGGKYYKDQAVGFALGKQRPCVPKRKRTCVTKIKRSRYLTWGTKLSIIWARMQQQLVLYQRDHTIITVDGSSIKKRRPRVNLDGETKRVWKLLLENINSEGINGKNEDETKWWESERKLYSGFAKEFILRMHLVQGKVHTNFLLIFFGSLKHGSSYMISNIGFIYQNCDIVTGNRGFSRWKGSVVDSVVGVFLTQNVSDYLSSLFIVCSDVFMLLAANFPLKTHNKERASSVIDYPIIHIPDAEDEWNRETSNYSKYEQNSMSVRIMDLDEGAIVNVHESSTCNTDLIQSAPGTYYELVENIYSAKFIEWEQIFSAKFIYHMGTEEANNDSLSLISGILSQNSTDSPVAQTGDMEEELCLERNVAMLGIIESDIIEHNDALKKEKVVPRKATRSRGIGKENALNKKQVALRKAKSRRVGEEIRDDVDWDSLRKQAEGSGQKRERSPNTLDSLDWDAVRDAEVEVIAKIIESRGVHNVLAQRIRDFLERLVKQHGSIDLEWLRDISPDQAKEYLLSIKGLGLKSVECVRLLTLHQQAFPVDTNIARIAVRLGWVPLEPLPESLQLHLLEKYPIHESVQKYLWPRLCKFEHKTLYELHYQMITFGKVFCTKSKPNCNACPMRDQCKHFASAFASARLSLPWPEENHLEKRQQSEENQALAACQLLESRSWGNDCAPIIEEPLSPEPESVVLPDIEDMFSQGFDEESDEIQVIHIRSDKIPSINLNIEVFNRNIRNYMQQNMIRMDEISKALVVLSADEAASIPLPKFKDEHRLRTKRQVYELPDHHPLLKELEVRDPDDPSPYLLAIWTPGKCKGETANSMEPPGRSCSAQENGKLCDEKACCSCDSITEENSDTVKGTILIPSRTAMRGSFPLNGTYFQVNEVFADHMTSKKPIDVPTEWIWDLPRRTVYFGTSASNIFRGLTTEVIQECFRRGYICVRGFDRKDREPKPLRCRLHWVKSRADREAKEAEEDKKKTQQPPAEQQSPLHPASRETREGEEDKKTQQPPAEQQSPLHSASRDERETHKDKKTRQPPPANQPSPLHSVVNEEVQLVNPVTQDIQVQDSTPAVPTGSKRSRKPSTRFGDYYFLGSL